MNQPVLKFLDEMWSEDKKFVSDRGNNSSLFNSNHFRSLLASEVQIVIFSQIDYKKPIGLSFQLHLQTAFYVQTFPSTHQAKLGEPGKGRKQIPQRDKGLATRMPESIPIQESEPSNPDK